MVWQSIHVEREALADQREQVDEAQWSTPSLCAGLTVREVLAHLTVSGAVSGPRWFSGVVRARFDFDKQVDARLREQLGTSSSETLSRFRSTIGSRTSPPLPRLALLGEMVVHGEDIRRPLGLVRDYPAAALVGAPTVPSSLAPESPNLRPAQADNYGHVRHCGRDVQHGASYREPCRFESWTEANRFNCSPPNLGNG